MTKYAIYNLTKQIARWIGVSITKTTFAREDNPNCRGCSVSRCYAMRPMGKRLKKHLKTTKYAYGRGSSSKSLVLTWIPCPRSRYTLRMDSVTARKPLPLFRERQTARLAPLTSRGENSVGKTSFLALLRSGTCPRRVAGFRQEPYDLGGVQRRRVRRQQP